MKNIWLSFFVLLVVTATSQVTELWNVSSGGGLNQRGLIYKINGDGTGFEELISMDSLGADNLCSELTLSQGYVYGFAYKDTSSFLYRINTTTRSYEQVINLPAAISSSRYFSKLTRVNGKYYFISASGGSNGYGGMYAYDTTAQTIVSLANFSTQTGFYPIEEYLPVKNRINGLTFADSSLYGAAVYGGQYSKGTIYKYTPSINTFEVVFNFGGNNRAAYPLTDLVAIDDYHLLGFSTDTAHQGLTVNLIFSFNRQTNYFFEFRELNNFDGVAIAGQIIYGLDGFVYASAKHGGAYGCAAPKDYGCGALIRYRPSDNFFEKLYDFQNPSDGSLWSGSNYNYFNPGITFGHDGNLYSTAGHSTASYAYSFNLNTKAFTTILSNYQKTPPLTIKGYYNFVNVTNGYLNINSILSSSIDVKVYPNPASKEVKVELIADEALDDSKFEIFDLLGRCLHKVFSKEKSYIVNIQNLTPGLYCWRYSTEKGMKTGKLLISTHD